MKVSTRSTYGMRALIELALSASRSPISASLIAKRHDLSVAYLEQLLHRLKRQGIVTSARGPKGGYLLARDPRRITMADVVRILDGMSGWAKADARGNGHAPRRTGKADPHRHARQIARAVWHCVHERLTQSLAEVTLQDLCEAVRTEAGEPLDHRYVFHI